MLLKRQFEIITWDDGTCQPVVDQIVEEFPLTVILDGRELATLLCSPGALEELTLGFLAAEGLIGAADDIETLHVDPAAQAVTVRTRAGFDTAAAERLRCKPTIITGGGAPSATDIGASGGPAPVRAELEMDADTVCRLMAAFQARATIFKETGGTHAAGLVVDNRITAFYEDIGRHNALDKILGHAVRAGVDFGRVVLLTSGRVSSEVVLKTARMGVPVLVSKSAPTAHAVDTARRLGVTVAGFVRGRRVNIYSGAERIRV